MYLANILVNVDVFFVGRGVRSSGSSHQKWSRMWRYSRGTREVSLEERHNEISKRLRVLPSSTVDRAWMRWMSLSKISNENGSIARKNVTTQCIKWGFHKRIDGEGRKRREEGESGTRKSAPSPNRVIPSSGPGSSTAGRTVL